MFVDKQIVVLHEYKVATRKSIYWIYTELSIRFKELGNIVKSAYIPDFGPLIFFGKALVV